MSRDDLARAARIADALLRNAYLLNSCQRRWRVIALAQTRLALAEIEIEWPELDAELATAPVSAPVRLALAGDLDRRLTLARAMWTINAIVRAPTSIERAALVVCRGGPRARAAQLAAVPDGVARRLMVCRERGVLTHPGTRRPPRFVGVPGERYPWSDALALALARRALAANNPVLFDGIETMAAHLEPTATLATARALDRYAAGDVEAAIDAAAAITGDGRRDRVRLELVAAAVERGDFNARERFAAAIAGARARDAALLWRGIAALRVGRAAAARRAIARVAHPKLAVDRDDLLEACAVARRTGASLPALAASARGLPMLAHLAAPMITAARGLETGALSHAVELMRDRRVVHPVLARAAAAVARRAGTPDHLALRFASVAGGRRVRSIWAAAMVADRLRAACRREPSVPSRRLAELRAALGGHPAPASGLGRAIRDEAIALEKQVSSRVAFCRAAARAAGGSLALVESRARSLALVGGGHAISALHRLIDGCADLPAQAAAALRALLAIDPRGAVDRILAANRADLLREAEDTGVLEPRFAESWCALWSRANALGQTRALADTLDRWRQRHGRLPPRVLLDSLAAIAIGSHPDRWPADVERALTGTPAEVASRLALDHPSLVKTIAVAAPVLPRRAPAWSAGRYAGVLEALHRGELGAVEPGRVSLFARLAGGRPRARQLASSLLAGSCPAPEAVAPLGERRRLRWLDKRRDLLTHLRFADAVGCCFTSSSDYYGCDCHGTRGEILRLWLDPLSFVTVIEAARSRRWELRGFVFGSFAIAGGAPVALLNGIYAVAQTRQRRAAVLGALEPMLRSIGVHRLAIANQHGGRGWLPANYHEAPVLVERLRALSDRGELQRDIYDDIGGPLNEPAYFDHLLWSPRLRRRPAQSA